MLVSNFVGESFLMPFFWSPDGEKIIFQTDQTFVAPRDGSLAQQFEPGTLYGISFDSRYALVEHTESLERTEIYDLQTGDVTPLILDSPELNLLSAMWTPNNKILFAGNVCSTFPCQAGIYIINLDGTGLQKISDIEDKGIGCGFELSPDHQWLKVTYCSNSESWLLHLETGNILTRDKDFSFVPSPPLDSPIETADIITPTPTFTPTPTQTLTPTITPTATFTPTPTPVKEVALAVEVGQLTKLEIRFPDAQLNAGQHATVRCEFDPSQVLLQAVNWIGMSQNLDSIALETGVFEWSVDWLGGAVGDAILELALKTLAPEEIQIDCQSLILDENDTVLFDLSQNYQVNSTLTNMSIIQGQIQLEGRNGIEGIQLKINDTELIEVGAEGYFVFQTAQIAPYTLQAERLGYLPLEWTGTINNLGENINLGEGLLLAGDLNNDQRIDTVDVVMLGSVFGLSLEDNHAADLDGNQQIDISDLILLSQNYRASGVQTWLPPN